MALITCPDCEKEISDQAAACPHCGRPVIQPDADPAGLFTEVPQERDPSFLKLIGALLFLGGISVGVYYFAYFDTTVAVQGVEILGQKVGGGRVHNIGLMEQRQTGLLLTGAVAAVGLLLVAFAEKLVGSSPKI